MDLALISALVVAMCEKELEEKVIKALLGN